jgi:hypothetical protein
MNCGDTSKHRRRGNTDLIVLPRLMHDVRYQVLTCPAGWYMDLVCFELKDGTAQLEEHLLILDAAC